MAPKLVVFILVNTSIIDVTVASISGVLTASSIWPGASYVIRDEQILFWCSQGERHQCLIRNSHTKIRISLKWYQTLKGFKKSCYERHICSNVNSWAWNYQNKNKQFCSTTYLNLEILSKKDTRGCCERKKMFANMFSWTTQRTLKVGLIVWFYIEFY